MNDHARGERLAPHEPPKIGQGRVIAKLGPWGIAAIAMGFVLACFLSAHFGAWYQRRIHAQMVAELPPMCEARGNNPIAPTCEQRFSCSKDELLRYRNACKPKG